MSDLSNNNSANNDYLKKGLILSDQFYLSEGKRPRILIGGTVDPLSLSINTIANSLADMGFDVDLSPKLKELNSLATQSLENDVDAILIYSDHCLSFEELLDFQKQVISNQPHMIMSLHIKNAECIASLHEHLSQWMLFGVDRKSSFMGYNLLKQILFSD